MSLRPQVCPAVPEETVRIARAAFPKGSRYMRLRDELGAVFDDSRFAGLFPTRGRPAEAPWRLVLVTLFQFEPPPNWWTPLVSSERSGKVSNGSGTASLYG